MESLSGLSRGFGPAALCVWLIAGHLVSFPLHVGVPLAGITLAVALLLISAMAVLRRRPVRPKRIRIIEAGIVLAMIIHALILPVASGEAQQSTHLLLVVVAAGCVLLSARWLALSLLVAIGGWTATVYFAVPDTSWMHYSLALALAVVLSLFAFFARTRSLSRLELERREQEQLRKKLEDPLEELKTNEERYRQLSAATTESLIVHRFGEVLDCNDNAVKLLGTPPGELIGRRIDEILEECSSDPIAAELLPANTREAIAIARGGRQIPVEVTTRAIQVAGRGAEVVAFRDVTARKATTMALGEQRAREHAILVSALDCIIAIDHEGRVIEWNPAAEATFGYSRDRAIGADLASLIIPDAFAERHRIGFKGYIESGGTSGGRMIGRRVEIVAKRADDSEFPAEIAVAATEDPEAPVFTAYLRDITDRKRAEVELSRTRDQAVRASRVKSEFLATMSHEIRTPMNGVLGMVGLLLQTELAESQRRQATAIKQSGDALMTIINDILDFSKIEAGKLELESSNFNLHRVVDETVELLATKVHGQPVEVAGHIAPDVPASVVGDPGRLRQVLLNLVGNAVKFTTEGQVVLRVALACEEEEGAPLMLLFEVEDTGPGIDEETQKGLFQPFVQGDASMSRRHAGTGLGLAVSRQLAELMGGEIGVDSKPGSGSTFWFTAKLARGTLAAPILDAGLTDRRVLVVASSETTREILTSYIGAWDLECGVAESAAEAHDELERARTARQPYDIALIDSELSDKAGIELAREMHDNVFHKSVRFILLASLAETGGAEASEDPAVAAVVPKPISRSQLLDSLTTAVGTSGSDSSQPPVSNASSSRDGRSISDLRVLVAEDNAVNQEVIRQLLTNMGHEVTIVVNGRDAVDAAKQGDFDLIFMDCQMPEMDGFEATREIRSVESADGHTPIVAMTANVMQGDRERCLESGMDDYVPKPVDTAVLESTLIRWAPSTCRRQGDGVSEPARSSDGARAGAEDVSSSTAGEPTAACKAGGELDVSVLEGLRGRQSDGKPDFVTRLIDLFVDQTAGYLESLREALDASSAEEIERIAHAIKGSSANVGATGMARISARLQELARGASVAESAPVIDALIEEFRLVRVELAGQRREPDSARGA